MYAVRICVAKLKSFLRKRKCESQKLELIPTSETGRKGKERTLGEKKHDMAQDSLPSQNTCSNCGYSWIPHAKTRAWAWKRMIEQRFTCSPWYMPWVLRTLLLYEAKDQVEGEEPAVYFFFVVNCKWVSTSSPETPRFHAYRNPANLLKIYLVYEGTSPCSNDSLGFLLGLEVYFKPAMTLSAHSWAASILAFT